MIEYKAYHKKSLGKRMRPHAARKKKKKGKEASPGRSRFRQAIPITAVALVILLLGAAGAAAFPRLGLSDIFSVRIVDMNPCNHVSSDEIAGVLKGVGRGNIWSLSREEIGRRVLSHPFVREGAGGEGPGRDPEPEEDDRSPAERGSRGPAPESLGGSLRCAGRVHAGDPGFRPPAEDRDDGFHQGDAAGGGGDAETGESRPGEGGRRPENGGPHLRAAGGINGIGDGRREHRAG